MMAMPLDDRCRAMSVYAIGPSNRPCDPSSFSGAPSKDVDECPHGYNHVNSCNNWDCMTQLADAIFHFQGMAKLWLNNREEEITGCDTLCRDMRQTFDSVDHRACSEI